MKDRVVLITGAAKGIGRETAAQLGGLGATVLLGARQAAPARAAAEELADAGDVRALEVDFDVADAGSVAAAAEAVASLGRLDVLINNAAAYVATLDDDGPSGGFFRDGAPLAW